MMSPTFLVARARCKCARLCFASAEEAVAPGDVPSSSIYLNVDRSRGGANLAPPSASMHVGPRVSTARCAHFSGMHAGRVVSGVLDIFRAVRFDGVPPS